MIEILNGIHETVSYNDRKAFKLYDNVEMEDYPEHWHSEIEVIMPITGDYYARVSGVDYLLHPDEILIINGGCIHYLKPTEPGERLIFQPDTALLHALPEMDNTMTVLPPALLITPENAPDIHPSIKEGLLETMRAYFSHNPLSETEIYTHLLKMFIILGRKYYKAMPHTEASYLKQNEYIEKFMTICSFINEHCTEDLNLDSISAKAGFSKYHFTRLFKQYTGQTFYKYLNIKRIAIAEKLLIDPTTSITDAAFGCGFTSISAFIRMFKQIKGCTPTEFRNMYRGC